jgi:hypothetical protein
MKCEASALAGFSPDDAERLRELLRQLFANLGDGYDAVSGSE